MPIVLNVFLTIPMNYFAEVQEDELLLSEDAVVVDMKIKRLYYFFENRKPTSTRIATVILKVQKFRKRSTKMNRSFIMALFGQILQQWR